MNVLQIILSIITVVLSVVTLIMVLRLIKKNNNPDNEKQQDLIPNEIKEKNEKFQKRKNATMIFQSVENPEKLRQAKENYRKIKERRSQDTK